MKKVFTLFAALMMIFSMNAAIYLPGSWNGWNQTGDAFSGTPLTSKITLAANTEYKFKVKDGSSWYGNNGTITSDVTNWTFSTSEGDCILQSKLAGVYTFTWDATNHKLSVAYPTEEVVVEYTYTIVGSSAALFGNTWDPSCTANDMTKDGATYTLTKTNITLAVGDVQYKVVREHAWGTGEYPSGTNKSFSITEAGVYDVTFTYDGGSNLTATPTLKEAQKVIPTIAVKGSWDEWTLKNLVLANDELTATATINIATVGDYKFGVDVDGVFTANGATVSRESNVVAGLTGNTGDMTLKADVAGEYTFTWTFETNTLTVTYPELPTYTVTVTAENGTIEGDGEYKEGTEVTLTATPAEGYQFVNWTVGEEVVSTDNPYSFVVTADVALVANFELIPPTKYNVTVTAENGTVEGAGEYEESTTATLTATPAEGYQFVNWTVGEEVVSTENPYSFVVTANIALVANFELIPVVEPEKPEPTYTENNLNPYAFGLESKLSADKETLTVTYRLNNSNATSVNVVIYNGEEVVATVEGTTTIGKNTVEVATGNLPAGVELKWAVEVNGTSVATPTQEAKIYSFYHPSGLDIDNNPENPTFGMLLINEGMQSVAAKTEGYVSAQFGAGIFAFTPSLDLIPNGEQPGYNGGIAFTETRADGSGTAYSPRRIRISEDGRIFVTSLNTDGNYLWEVNPENMNEWTPIFKGASVNENFEVVDAEGKFIAAPNAGFDVKGSGEDLQLLMLSVSKGGFPSTFAQSAFQCYEYNLGTNTTWDASPSKLIFTKYAINYTGAQVQYDNEGGVWMCQNQSATANTKPSLIHVNAAGEVDLIETVNNRLNGGIRFNNDFTKVIIAGIDAGTNKSKKATIYTISKDANGAPVLSSETVVDMTAVGNNLNDFAWDYAGNLYACGNSSEKLAAWAMPYSGTVETPAASKYAFQLEGEPVDQYEVYEDEITNFVFDLESMMCYGGPSENFQVDVFLVLGEDNGDGTFALTDESSISVQGSDATFIEGYLANIDVYAPKADAVIRCDWNGMKLELHLAMSAAPIEATKVVVENAAIEIEKYLLFGDTYDYSLKMTGVWTDAEGLDYPVLVEVPVYYPESTEPYEMMSTVTVGGWADDENWLGFGEGYLTITTVDDIVTATGIVENPMAGIAIDITISGSLSQGPGTALENATVVIKSIKKIQNGQLIIEKGGVQYNAQGAIVK